MKTATRDRLTWALFAAVTSIAALVVVTASNAAGAAASRKKLTCDEFRADMERSTKAVGFPMTLKPGDWGKTPAPLRGLPPKAALCGSTMDSVFIASPLTGKELEAYYTPILTKMGCKQVKCEFSDKKTSCSCRVTGGMARVGTEELSEAYAISWIPM